MSPLRTAAGLVLMLAALGACGSDGPSDPGPDPESGEGDGSLGLTTVSTGDDLDSDGYVIEVDGVESGPIGGNAASCARRCPRGQPRGAPGRRPGEL